MWFRTLSLRMRFIRCTSTVFTQSDHAPLPQGLVHDGLVLEKVLPLLPALEPVGAAGGPHAGKPLRLRVPESVKPTADHSPTIEAAPREIPLTGADDVESPPVEVSIQIRNRLSQRRGREFLRHAARQHPDAVLVTLEPRLEIRNQQRQQVVGRAEEAAEMRSPPDVTEEGDAAST